MELVTDPVATVKPQGPAQNVTVNRCFAKSWQRMQNLVTKSLHDLWMPAVSSIVDSVPTSTNSSEHAASGFLQFDTATADMDRQMVVQYLVKSLRGRLDQPAVVSLMSDVHKSLSAVNSAIDESGGDTDDTPAAFSQRPTRLVVCVQDAERFNGALLRDIIYSLAVRGELALRSRDGAAAAIDVVAVIVCMRGTVDTFFELLSRREASLLDVSAEGVPDTVNAFNHVIREPKCSLMTWCHTFLVASHNAQLVLPRKLGPQLSWEMYNLIREDFELRDRSISGFMRILRLSLIVFFTGPLHTLKELLCREPPSAATSEAWKKSVARALRDTDMKLVAQLESVESTSPTNAKGETGLEVEQCISWAHRLVEHRVVTPVLERCLAAPSSMADSDGAVAARTSGSTWRTMFESGMQGRLKSQGSAEMRARKLSALKPQVLREVVAVWEKELRALIDKSRDSDLVGVTELLSTTEDAKLALDGKGAAADKDRWTELVQKGEPTQRREKRPRIGVSGSNSALQRRAQQLSDFFSSTDGTEGSNLDTAQRAGQLLAVQCLHRFAELVVPIETLPMSELVCMRSEPRVREYSGCSAPEPRTSLVLGLNAPHVADSEAQCAFEVLCTFGRDFSIEDWRQAFLSKMGESHHSRSYLAGRFARACTDLEYLGFVRQNPRRPGCARRLFWEFR